MKNILKYLALVVIFSVAISCNKEEDPEQPAATIFSFSCPDSLVFEHSDTKSIVVSVQSESNKEFFATFEDVPSNFGYHDSPTSIVGNQSGTLNIDFYQTFSIPGSFSTTVSVYVPNENNAIKSKQLKLVYRPNCLYYYRNHVYGQLTYVSNGQLLNKTITCAYNLDGRLKVSGLTPYDILLNADCTNQTVAMVPFINNGFYMTGTGQIEGNEISLQIFSDGNLHSNSRIKLQ